MSNSQATIPQKLSVSFSKPSLMTMDPPSGTKNMQEYNTVENLSKNKYLMKNMKAQMNRYGSILEKQRKRVQSVAMLSPIKPTRSTKTRLQTIGHDDSQDAYQTYGIDSIGSKRLNVEVESRYNKSAKPKQE